MADANIKRKKVLLFRRAIFKSPYYIMGEFEKANTPEGIVPSFVD
jgi:hypothetical protein